MTTMLDPMAWRAGSRGPMAGIRPRRCARALVLCAGIGAWAAAAQAATIYTCVDAAGKRHTSDRPIAECGGREQRVLNPDGSVRRIVPAEMTSEERSAIEARERAAVAERTRQQEAVRRDRNLLSRYPTEAAHQKARAGALDDMRKSVREAQSRLAELAAERKPLDADAEFYAGKPLPLKLRLALSANEASVEAQKALIQSQQAEVERIDKRYDAELERLRKLWTGAAPGSLDLVTRPTSASAPSK